MIHIIDKYGWQDTTIQKIDRNRWEFMLLPRGGIGIEKKYVFKEPVIIGRQGITDIIQALQKMLARGEQEIPEKEKKQNITWISNSANVTMECYYFKSKLTPRYNIIFYYDRRAVVSNLLSGEDIIYLENFGVDRSLTGRKGIGISLPKENVEKYILELQVEIGKKTQEELDEFLEKWKEPKVERKFWHLWKF